MKSNKAMKLQGLRYFSSLTAKQKDKVIFNILKLKHNLSNLPDELCKKLLFEINDISVTEKIQGTKLFLHKDNFYPLNFKEFINQK